MLPPCMLLRTAGVVVAVPHMALLRMRRRERELQAKAMPVALMVLTASTLVAVNGVGAGGGKADPRKQSGVGIAVGGWPCGMGPASAVCRVDSDGTVRVHVGTVDVSGANSSYVLVAAEVLGVAPEQIEIVQGDTSSGPFGPPSGGSQTTYSTAGAVAGAARVVRERLLQIAGEHFEASVEDLEIRDGFVYVKGVPDGSPYGSTARPWRARVPCGP